MRKVILIFGICAVVGAGAAAQSSASKGSMLLAPHDLDLSAGLGSGFFIGSAGYVGVLFKL